MCVCVCVYVCYKRGRCFSYLISIAARLSASLWRNTRSTVNIEPDTNIQIHTHEHRHTHAECLPIQTMSHTSTNTHTHTYTNTTMNSDSFFLIHPPTHQHHTDNYYYFP